MSDLSYGSLYREGLLMAAMKELPKYTLNLVGVQEVRWERNYTEPANKYTLFYEKGHENHELGTVFCA
jgi:hypothetical protein